MKLETLFKMSLLCGVLLVVTNATSYGQSFTVDGYKTGSDAYTNKTAVYFFNGHEEEAYGTIDNPIYQTYVHWGQGKLSGNPTGPDYFFMYVETPIEVKNMIWGNEVTTADIAEYDVHYSNHHGDDPDMDYGQATGSEYMAFYDKDGKEQLKSDLDKFDDDVKFGFIDGANSLEYLLNNGATTATSTALGRQIGMAFEYQFALDVDENNALLDVVRDGGIIEYHLSPERGLLPTQVPEPSSALMVMLSSISLLRRKR